jgi:hypothetical protein
MLTKALLWVQQCPVQQEARVSLNFSNSYIGNCPLEYIVILTSFISGYLALQNKI